MQQTTQKMLDENHHLIQFILDYQSKGKTVSAPSTSRPCTGTWPTRPRSRTPTRICSPCCTAAHAEQDAGPCPPEGCSGAQARTSGAASLMRQPPACRRPPSRRRRPTSVRTTCSRGRRHRARCPVPPQARQAAARARGPATATRDRPRRAYRLQGQGAISNDMPWANINMQPNPGGFGPLQLGAGREPAPRRPVHGHDGRSGQGSSAVGQRPTGRYWSSRQGSFQSSCAGGRTTGASCTATARPPRSP